MEIVGLVIYGAGCLTTPLSLFAHSAERMKRYATIGTGIVILGAIIMITAVLIPELQA